MARLTDIIDDVKALLAGITIANGYDFDMGTVNQPDQALATLPSADITYTEETAVPLQHGYKFADVDIEIRFRTEQTGEVWEVPIRTIDDAYDTILDNVKEKFYTVNNQLTTGAFSTIEYVGFTRETDAAGDVQTPGSLIMKFKVNYQQI